MSAELCVVIPTLNERDNIEPLLGALARALEGVAWEVVFVDDDSTDGTTDLLRDIARHDERVRCLRRIGRRGLASACIEGMEASTAPYLAVMDADMQHDERLLREMLEVLRAGAAELVVGSRYLEGASTGQWSRKRLLLSRIATRMGRMVVPLELTDPLSGYFMLERPVLERAVRRMSAKGFKVLIDLVASVEGPLRCKELQYTFRPRVAGRTKLDTLVAGEYALLLYDKLLGRYLPARFLMFVTVGAVGVVVHLAVLGVALLQLSAPFAIAQSVAAVTAMLLNFTFNNVFTHRDIRLRGAGFLKGLTGFVLICSIGAVVNVHLAHWLYQHEIPWWLAGLLGAIIGAVWNYAVTSTLVWRRHQ